MLTFNTVKCRPGRARAAQRQTGNDRNDGQDTVKTILKLRAITSLQLVQPLPVAGRDDPQAQDRLVPALANDALALLRALGAKLEARRPRRWRCRR